MFWFRKREQRVLPEEALPGRDKALCLEMPHRVLGVSMMPPFPEGMCSLLLGMGCFWGAERLFWGIPGVYVTAVGYAGGYTPNPSYEEVSSGRTGHAEVVMVVFDPRVLPYETLLRIFWESHDPAAGMRQGNDVGTQYRSALWPDEALGVGPAMESREGYQRRLRAAGIVKTITTEIGEKPLFYYAEEHHQQYLVKHPDGYCGLRGLGVSLSESGGLKA